ncbi:MAG TPA: glycoside hydrolase family 172 protein [Armatimonadota bacterium]|jgi:hypothetical protein
MSLLDDLMGSLAAPPVGRNRRVSSNEQPNWNDGNFDMTPLAPGQTLELPLLEGPGVITHIWLTSHAGGMGELDALSLRIYWDGSDEPGVEVPLGQFFAVGQGRPAVVESVPVQVSPTGSLTCYWRMPFARSARIVVTNDNPDRSTGLYWQVDWTQLPELPKDTAYFYARYRQEHPAVMGRDYLIADLEGTGKFVGAVMCVTLAQDGWFGEGDDFFYIDGEAVPSLQGTGSEDYFNDAWGFRKRTSAWFGQPRWQGWSAGDAGVCYRWHLLDPVHFHKSLKVAIEHKGNRNESEDAWYIERPDFFSSVAFWYQTGKPKPFGELPSWPQRCVPWVYRHLVRAFRRAEVSGTVPVGVSAVGFFGGRPTLVWPNTEEGACLSVPFSVEEEGRYAVRLSAFRSPGYGAFAVDLDGRCVVERMDLNAPEAEDEELEEDRLLGTHDLSAGEHTLSFRALSPSCSERTLTLEAVRLLRLPPEATRELRTENEAHFIRLGLGRAIYAYRLAFDDLPDSLQQLVDAGVMDPRYLKDENGYDVKAWRDGDHFHTESTRPGGWKKDWLGLDARR